jgi:hypothetical protein
MTKRAAGFSDFMISYVPSRASLESVVGLGPIRCAARLDPYKPSAVPVSVPFSTTDKDGKT